MAASLLGAYCRSLDTGDRDALRSLFTADAKLILDNQTVSGVDAIAASYEPFFASRRVSRHHLTNIELLHASDTELEARAYLLVVTERAGQVSIASGTYHDDLLCSGNEWHIRRKQITLEVPFTRVGSLATDS